jgi:uncharacterized protein with NRDE domain
MCLITFAHRWHREYPLLVAANRDEYYARPTAGIHFWEDTPQLAAGRDLQAGGTWMGLTRNGRFAAITNHRNPPSTPPSPRSRGMLTLDFLAGDASPRDFLGELSASAGDYAGFNLVVGDGEELWYFSNMESRARALAPGIYSISNGLLDSEWPKQRRAEQRLAELRGSSVDHGQLERTVSDRDPAPDEQLPDTGVGLELERALSSQFIVMPEYGTRATTTLSVSDNGQVEMVERQYDSGGTRGEERSLSFPLAGGG